MIEKILPFDKNNLFYNKDSYDWNKLINMSEEGVLFGEFCDDVPPIGNVQIVCASHIINNLIFKDDDIYGEIECLETINGNILNSVLLSSIPDLPLKYVPRGIGKMKDGIIVFEDIIAIDCIIYTLTLKEKRLLKLDKLRTKIDEDKKNTQ